MDKMICMKCNMEMVEVTDIKLKLGIMPIPDASGLRCPKCKAELLSKELILGDLAEAEKMMQGK